ncbi:hypothetical protein BV25DRAFT_1879222 [Artomyces pyxidatus]|uniref:Uncharacterized protein n=1 Tax=Artomyces pyxidatus TaxID=48021 RepID=A0ACB8TCW4_9AGAM|nr:hypothetical protein BV25DRAFT_1879222 [Artomyces pyxidatus]
MADVARPRLNSLAGSILSHRVLLYTLASSLAVSATIGNALQSHSNFYSVTVYLSKSGGSVLVLANFGLLVALVCGRLVQQIFFGALRAVEVERLYDRMWFFVTESLLAFTIFRDEFDIPFAVMFGFLLFVKSFHWLMADRIEWMNQMPFPGPSPLFHIRVNSLFIVLWMTNLVMFAFAVESVLASGVGAIVLFASEYAILMASLMNSMAKYVLSAIEFRRAATRGAENAPPWENKSMWVFYVDLVTDFLKLVTYLAFFAIVITFYGVPLNVIRDVYVTARSFITRLRDLMRYRTATRNMDERYPNATEEEMSAMSDRTCIICREEMVLPDTSLRNEASAQNPGSPAPAGDGPNTTPKKLPCGHIFHFHCLRSWLERQQSCPTCRRGVLEASPPSAPVRPGQADAVRGAAGQPGAVPPAPNPFGPPAEGQQPPAAGHLGNFMRGLFGVAQPPQPQPPPLLGPPPIPQPDVQIPQNFGWGPGYMPPAGVPFPQQAPQHLQPPPVFQGFYGPGGIWQPWVMDPGRVDPAQQAPNDGQHQGTSSAPVATSSHDEPAPSPAAPETLSTNADGNERHPVNAGPSATPRDAAGLAALRRLGTSTASAPSQSQSAPRASSSFRSDASDGGSLPPTSSIAPSTSAAGAPPVPSASLERRDVPSLIPLYNLSLVQGRSGVPGSSRPTQSTSTQARGSPPTARTPLSALPPTLTEEQLGRLDVLTRDSIDERLRVLESVSGAIYRCVEELTRLRSVLPPSPSPLAQTSEAASAQAGPSAVSPAPAPALLRQQHAAPGAPEDHDAGTDVSRDNTRKSASLSEPLEGRRVEASETASVGNSRSGSPGVVPPPGSPMPNPGPLESASTTSTAPGN